MPIIGSISVNIGANTQAFINNMRQVQSQIQNTARQVNTNGNQMSSGFGASAMSISRSIQAYIVAKGFQLLIQGVEASVEAYNKFESANMGLKSIMDGQGRSFEQAKQFVQDYTKDGLVPLSDATASYKMLASRGYSDDQIKNVMNRLKDTAAFGRQSNLSLGEAVRTASEGLKSENSILVDNAGVTKNVAKMWDDYAKSIGTTANKLTQQQKIQAEVDGIMEESKYQVGDAAKYSQTLGGRLAATSAQFNMMSVAVGSALSPVLMQILPIVSDVILSFTSLFNTISNFTRAIFGNANAQQVQAQSTQKVAQSAGVASNAQKGLGKATKKAGKEAKGSTASFDEINTLTEKIADNADDAAGAMDGVGGGGVNVPKIDAPDTSSLIPKDVLDMVDRLKERWNPILVEVGKAWDNLKKSVSDFWNSPFMNIVKVAVADTLEQFAKGALKSLGGAFEAVAGNVKVLDGLFNGDFKKALEGVEEIISGFYDFASGTIIALWPDAEEKLKHFKTYLSDTWTNIKNMSWSDVKDVVLKSWDDLKTYSATKWDSFKTWLSAKWELFKTEIGWDSIKNTILQSWDDLKTGTSTKWNEFKTFLSTTWELFKTEIGWDAIKTTILTSWDDLKTQSSIKFDSFKKSLKETWEKFKTDIGWNDIKTTILQAWDDLKKNTLSIFDTDIFNGIKASVNKWIDLINGFINKINSFKIAIPSVNIPGVGKVGGGEPIGFNISTIPKLATGTNYVPQDMLIYAHEGESVVPKKYNPAYNEDANNNTSMVDSIAGAVGTAVMSAMQFVNSSQTGNQNNGNIILQMDTTEVARALIPSFNKESNRVGKALISPV